jgi:peptidoglycan/LPS O-acetylase OafA/YrhL
MLSRLATLLSELPGRYARVTSSQSYVPQIDGLRFLAILPVLLWHASLRADRLLGQASEAPISKFLPHGEVGVFLFFFISGYIITHPFAAAAASGAPRPQLKKFYARRVLRLEPPYFIALLGCFLLLTVTGYTPTDAPQFGTYAPLGQNLAASLVYMHGLIFNWAPRLDPPLWSLEVEIQFYLLAPFIIALLLGIKDYTVRLGAGLAVIIASVLLANALNANFGAYNRHHWTLLGYFAYFFLGVLVSDYVQRADPRSRPAKHAWDIVWLAGVLGLGATGMVKVWPGFSTGVCIDTLRLLSILGIYFGVMRGKFGRQILGAPWIALIGGMCYSIYLTHVPVMQALTAAISHFGRPSEPLEALALAMLFLAPVSVVCGFIYYVLIERPCMDPQWPKKLASFVMQKSSGLGRARAD